MIFDILNQFLKRPVQPQSKNFKKSPYYFDVTLLSQSGTELSANPSFSQSLISIKSFGHGSPMTLGYWEIDLTFITGTIVEMVNYNFNWNSKMTYIFQ